MTIVLIILAVIFYCISALSIAALTTVYLDKIGCYSSRAVMKVSVFWIFVIPWTAIYLMNTKKGERALASIFEIMNV